MVKNWWKESVVYQIYPRSFKDSNGDGIGDLRGIIEKLDYLQSLGVDVLWLSPIYKSPNDDNGYDISDYMDIMDEFGTMADFDEMLEGIHQRGMKLLMDLVVNHSSDEHRWFQESRKSADNPYSDYYFWSKEKPSNWQAFFGGDAWTWDDSRQAYYLHLFTKKQPDLNWENPKVRQEIYEMMRFWLDKGVDGFRMDVISLISKRLEFKDADFSDFNQVIKDYYANGPRVHEFLQEMNKEVLSHYDIMTVGEGPGITQEVANLYVGKDRRELNMIFHFDHMFIDHGKGGKFDVVDISLTDFKRVFQDWHRTIGEKGWNSIFLDNHDFPRLVSRWGDDGAYRSPSAKLLAMLVMTQRGTAYIYQGSEIGMTNVAFESPEDYRDIETLNYFKKIQEDGGDMDHALKMVHIQGRDNVRTPVQWDDSKYAGFSTVEPWIKVNPNYKEINAGVARNKPNSIFYFYQSLLRFRKENPCLVYGDYKEVSEPDDNSFYAYYRYDDDDVFLIMMNFTSDHLQTIPSYQADNWKLEVCNYKEEGKKDVFRPWEARLYRVID